MPQVIQEVTPHSPKIGLQSHQSLNTVNTEPEILGSRENTTLPGLYFPENPKRGRVFMYEPEGSGLVFFLISTMCTVF